jgi:hypothetical protein
MPPLKTYKVLFKCCSQIQAIIYAYDLDSAKRIADKYFEEYDEIEQE